MKDYPYVPGWRQNKENNKPAINHSILMFTTHGIAEGEWNGNEWIQYRWSGKVKDSDVLYWIHLEDLTQLEKEGDLSLQQEQPEVDFETEYAKFSNDPDALDAFPIDLADYKDFARHFYELGLKARKEENK